MRRQLQHSGFTLVEVLVSVGIALLLILGVNQVFKVSAQTVGEGESLLSATRDARTVLQSLLADLNGAVPVPTGGSTIGNAPFFAIRTEIAYAYRNAAEAEAGGPKHAYRLDRLGFFSRGLFSRQTSSNANQLVSQGTASEAYIVYGHAQLPNNAMLRSGTGNGAYYGPGDPSPQNDTNQYACDWMLARNVTLLNASAVSDPTAIQPNPNPPPGVADLSPLTANSMSGNGASLNSSQTDVAATSIANLGSKKNGISSVGYSNVNGVKTANPNNGTDWWTPVIGGSANGSSQLFHASPHIVAGGAIPKITNTTIAICSPNLIRGCSQFIVEYAGNFYTKNADGTPSQNSTGADPSGQLDYYTDANGVPHTRWYGFPRSTSGNASPSAASGDVVPLRDVAGSQSADAERFGGGFPTSGKYSSLSQPPQQGPNPNYTAAWGPDVQNMSFPKMLRITIEIEDHQGLLRQPQRYEFIYDVQQ